MNKPKIAVTALGHYIYFDQFEGLHEELSKKADEFMAMFDRKLCDIWYTGYVDTVEGAFIAVRELEKQNADFLFVILTTYVPSSVAAPFAYYADIPQALVGIQPLDCLDYKNATTYMQLVNDDICAMPEVVGVYERLGSKIPPCIVASSSQKDYLQKEISGWQHAIAAKAAFKYATIGYLGHTYEGMYDMHTDPTAFTRSFGAHVKMLEMCELVSYADAVTQNEINRKIDTIENTFDICEPSLDPLTDYVNQNDLELTARLACALDRLVKNNNLSALAYYYKGEADTIYEQYAANLIIGNTLLTSANIPLAGEADLKTAAAMLIMNRIGGGGSFAEIHPFDICDDVVLIGHDGPHNIAIAEGKPKLRKLRKYHGKSGCGIGVEFSLKAGPVTMLSITVDGKGSMKMVAAAGTSLKGDIPQTGNTNTRVTFGCPIHTFLSRWCEAGPTHHVALGIGNHIDTLQKFSRITGIPLTVVS